MADKQSSLVFHTLQESTAVRACTRGYFLRARDGRASAFPCLALAKGRCVEFWVVNATFQETQCRGSVWEEQEGCLEMHHRRTFRSTVDCLVTLPNPAGVRDHLLVVTASLEWFLLSWRGSIVAGSGTTPTLHTECRGMLCDPTSKLTGDFAFNGVGSLVDVQSVVRGKNVEHRVLMCLANDVLSLLVANVSFDVWGEECDCDVTNTPLAVSCDRESHSIERKVLALAFLKEPLGSDFLGNPFVVLVLESLSAVVDAVCWCLTLRGEQGTLLKTPLFEEGPWCVTNVQPSSRILLPCTTQLGGVLVVSDCDVLYVTHGAVQARSELDFVPTCASRCDPQDGTTGGGSFLLGAEGGGFFTLSVDSRAGDKSADLTVTAVTVASESPPSSGSHLAWLGRCGLLFQGSQRGPSQLFQWSKWETASGLPSRVTELTLQDEDVMPDHCAPLVDALVADPLSSGESQVFCCTGMGQSGALRHCLYGPGLETSVIGPSMPGHPQMFTLRSHGATADDRKDKFLLFSYRTWGLGRGLCSETSTETKVMCISGTEFGPASVPGLTETQRTLAVSACEANFWIQVTACEVRVIDEALPEGLKSYWCPSEGCLEVADAFLSRVVVSFAKALLSLEVTQAGLVEETARAEVTHQVSAIGVSRVDGRYVAVAEWVDNKVSLYRCSDLQRQTVVTLAAPVRSLVLASLSEAEKGATYLVLGLADGKAAVYLCNPSCTRLSHKHQFTVGATSCTLKYFRQPCQGKGLVAGVMGGMESPKQGYVYVNSDHAALIWQGPSLDVVCARVHEGAGAAVSVISVDTGEMPDSFAWIDHSDVLTFGTLDTRPAWRSACAPLGRTPLCIAYASAHDCLVTATQGDDEVNRLHLHKCGTHGLTEMWSMELTPGHSALAITCVGGRYICVSSYLAGAKPSDDGDGAGCAGEGSDGTRTVLSLFEVKAITLEISCEQRVCLELCDCADLDDLCCALAPLHERYLVAGAGRSVVVFEVDTTHTHAQLTRVASVSDPNKSSGTCTSLSALGATVLAGDFFNGLTVYRFSEGNKLLFLAGDACYRFNPEVLLIGDGNDGGDGSDVRRALALVADKQGNVDVVSSDVRDDPANADANPNHNPNPSPNPNPPNLLGTSSHRGATHHGVVTRLCRGKLGVSCTGGDEGVSRAMVGVEALFFSADGTVGALWSVDGTQGKALRLLQERMRPALQGVRWVTDSAGDPSSFASEDNIIDGDVIASFLDLSADQAEAVAASMDQAVADVARSVNKMMLGRLSGGLR